MRIALISEPSSCLKNKDVMAAMTEVCKDHEIYNMGMTDPDEKPAISYINAGIMAAVLLNSGAVDFVVSGCGTGEGALISMNHYPNVFCGFVLNDLDAYLFSQINAGNAISLALNKGYGWGADLNLKYIFEKLFSEEWGNGYPKERKEPQTKFRNQLSEISKASHKDMLTILKDMPREHLQPLVECKPFMDCINKNAPDSELTAYMNSLK